MTQEVAIRFIQQSESEDSAPMVSSREVAKKFGKQHKDVLRAINDLTSSTACSEFSRRNLAPRDYVDARGKTQPEMLMTRDGFALVAMGFLGEEALVWKIKFLEAFDKLILNTAQLKKEVALLKLQNRKLIADSGKPPTASRKSNVLLPNKKIAIHETDDDGEIHLVQVLASSLELPELADAIAAARSAQAVGAKRQAKLAKQWATAVTQWDDDGRDGECPLPTEYVKYCEYTGFFQTHDDDEEEDEDNGEA